MKLLRCLPATSSPDLFFDKSLFTEGSRFSAPLVFFSGCVLWFLSHPYWGVWHDAMVYTLMALHWDNPTAFAHDPWFMFGSQDRYTIFSPLYAGLISLLGVEKAALWGTVAEGMLYVISCWILCRALPLKTGKYLVFLLLVSTQVVYCANNHSYFGPLRISETFITSRNLAITLSLISLSAMFNGKKSLAFGGAFLSMAFHPLMGGWILLLLLVFVMNLSTRTVWLLCIFGVYIVGGFAFFNIGIFKLMTADWAQHVRNTSGIVFPKVEEQQYLGFYIAGYSLLHFAGHFGMTMLRQWYKWIMAISFSATLLFWFCSTHAPSALIMQLQLWRANWLALIFVIIAIIDLAGRAWMGGNPRRLISLTLGMIFLFTSWGTLPFFMVCGSFPVQSLRFARFLLHRYHKYFWQGLKVVLVVLLALWLGEVFLLANIVGKTFSTIGTGVRSFNGTISSLQNISMKDIKYILMGIGFTGGKGGLALTMWILLASRFRTLTAVGVLILTLIVAPGMWDTQALRDNKFSFLDYKKFKMLIKPGDTVYWQQRPLTVYFSLHTANYVSNLSLVGLVFSEAKTKEVVRRLQRIALAGANEELIFSSLSGRDKAIRAHYQKYDYFDPDKLDTYRVKELSRPGLEFLCSDPQLGYVIHEQLFPGLALATEKDEIGEKKTWYLYGCRDLRDKQKHKL